MSPATASSCQRGAMADKIDTRYGQNPGSGANEPKRHEKKEQDPDWRPRQGGDQTRGDEDAARDAFTRPGPSDPGGDRAQGKETRGKDVIATRRHLEGSEQGPQ
jgi:hypothetical protein